MSFSEITGETLVTGGLVFTLGLAVDIVYVYWTIAATTRRPTRAALMAAAIQLFGVGALLFVINDPTLLVANILGHASGSYLGVMLNKGNDKCEPRF